MSLDAALSLGLPVAHPRRTAAAAALLCAYYLLSGARDVSTYDSPELALAALQLGLGHPPGQPLHTLLGALACRLPGVSPWLGVLLPSALPAALAVVPLTSLAERAAPPGPRSSATPFLVALACTHAALWESATRPEVYTLASFFGLWALAALTALCAEPDAPRTSRRWAPPALALGLAAASNPMLAVFAALASGPLLLWRFLRAPRPPVLPLLLGGLAPLALYLYVPWSAQRTGVLVWGRPSTGAALRRFLSAADYGSNYGISARQVARNALEWAQHALSLQRGPVLLGALAWALTARSVRGAWALAPVTLAASVWLAASNALWHPAISDVDGYTWMGVALSLVGLVGAWSALAPRVPERLRPLYPALGALLLAAVVAAPPAPWARTRSRDHVERALAEGVLAEAPPRAVLVTAQDHWVMPLLYLQRAEGLRPDVVVLAEGLASSSWFWEQLAERHRDLAPFALRGPGGRERRIARFLQAQRAAGRPVLYETALLARRYAGRFCARGWFAAEGALCEGGAPWRGPEGVLQAQAALVGRGSPTSDAVLARAAQDRAELASATGYAAAAVRTLRAGVSPSLLPPLRAELPERVSLPPLPPARFVLRAVVGDAGQNLWLAARLLGALGLEEDAAAHLRAAEALGAREQGP